MSDMRLGIECLTTDDATRATDLARQLDAINRERRDVEGGMRAQAESIVDEMFDESDTPPAAITVFDPDFHEGIVGIVAGRIKDRMHRPTFVFAPSGAPGQGHVLKGSGRSIAGFHLRDALDLLAKRHPEVLLRFGGHAMAAGCTIEEDNVATFEMALEQIAADWLDEKTLQRELATDGPLPKEFRRADVVDLLNTQVWGNGFAPPLFSDDLRVISQRIVGEKHLGLKLQHHGEPVDGIWFGHTASLPDVARLAYRMEVDEWQGQRRVKFMIEGMAG
jgi:single-stranded-DNA-specific exonuclease